jgi:hypothetical protein
VSVPGSKRPRFVLDLAEELVWLKNKAGPDVAERWYAALLATIDFIEKNPFVGRIKAPQISCQSREHREPRSAEYAENPLFSAHPVFRGFTRSLWRIWGPSCFLTMTWVRL